MERNIRIIKLNSIERVKNFVQRVSAIRCDVDILCGRHVIDGKSIMAIFSLNLTEPLKAVIHTDDEEEIKRFNDIMEDFE